MIQKLMMLVIVLLSMSVSISFADAPTRPKAPYVNSQTVRQWQSEHKDVVLVDVRQPKEYDAGHIEGAINVPYTEVEKRIKEFKKEVTPAYVFYCTYSAWRAPYAANVLADYGYQNTYVLEGGVSAWNAGGQVIYATDPNQKAEVIPYSKTDPKILYHPKDNVYAKKLNLTLEELKKYDGQNGRPAYVAVKGVIYDVTESRLWRGGTHSPTKGKPFESQVLAGRDLTELLKKSPHGTTPLKDFPAVGKLVKSKK